MAVSNDFMNNQRMHLAIERIEAAAERIAISTRERPLALASAPGEPSVADDPGLAERHAALREEAGVALAELDRLLSELGE